MTTARAAWLVPMGALLLCATPASPQQGDPFMREFELDRADLRSTGRNPFFVLEPGYQLVLEDGDERLEITVLRDTVGVDGVTTRVVEERESKAGRMVEVSRNYYAISARTNSVYYFGEDVDMYRGGVVTSHDGGWRAGTRGARFGLMMAGLPILGGRYYQEQAPGVALDRAHIVGVGGSLTTPAGAFRSVLRIEETTPLEPASREYKLYGPGVGLLQDGSLTLVRHGVVTGR